MTSTVGVPRIGSQYIVTRQRLCLPPEHKFLVHYYPLKLGSKYVETTKCLGVIIDKHLKWQYQIDAVCESYAAKVKKLKSLEFSTIENVGGYLI